MTATKLLRQLLPGILIFLIACGSKKQEPSTEALVLPKKTPFYEQFIYADNKEKDTLLYFKIDLLTRKWDYRAHSNIKVGLILTTEENIKEGYPSSLFVHYSYVKNIREKSDTLFSTSPAKSQPLSIHVDEDGNEVNVPKRKEVVTYKSFRAADPSVHISFSQYFNVSDSVNYTGRRNVFENLGMMDNIILNLRNDLKDCAPKTKRVIMRTIMSDLNDVVILRKTYPLDGQ